MTDRAALIGAANTLYFSKNGKVHADNTDGYGFIQNIIDEIPDYDFYDKTALIWCWWISESYRLGINI